MRGRRSCNWRGDLRNMSVIKYSNSIIDKFPQIFDSVDNSSIQKFLTYMINSKYKHAVELKSWLKAQVEKPTPSLYAFLDKINMRENVDCEMNAILDHVAQRVSYMGDSKKWNMLERWQTAEETASDLSGDCEDHAVLMYVLARMRSIPANRLVLFCGDVLSPSTNKEVGHCWLGYRPYNFPLNFAFMDSTWHYNSNPIMLRNLFTVIGKEVFEYKKGSFGYVLKDSSYRKIWFCFNENKSWVGLGKKC